MMTDSWLIERAAIVAWLRSKDEGTLVGWRPELLAALIERGEHRTDGGDSLKRLRDLSERATLPQGDA